MAPDPDRRVPAPVREQGPAGGPDQDPAPASGSGEPDRRAACPWPILTAESRAQGLSAAPGQAGGLGRAPTGPVGTGASGARVAAPTNPADPAEPDASGVRSVRRFPCSPQVTRSPSPSDCPGTGSSFPFGARPGHTGAPSRNGSPREAGEETPSGKDASASQSFSSRPRAASTERPRRSSCFQGSSFSRRSSMVPSVQRCGVRSGSSSSLQLSGAATGAPGRARTA